MKNLYLSAAVLIALGACSPQDDGAGSEILPQTDSQSADLHQSFLVMDSHLDTPAYFHRETYDFSKRGSFAEDGTHVDLPRMREGGLDGGFWVIYTPQGQLDEASYTAALTSALLRQMSIREMAAKYADDVELAFTADDAERIHAEGKIVVFQSMENAYPLGEDLSILESFYVGGLRMVSPAHFRNNQFSDSATDVTEAYDGLSPLGEELVREANRLGLILDGSHASDDTVMDMIALSETPIILSHSGPAAVFDHPRNVPDELLIALAEDGGVIQINALGAYLEQLTPTPERQAALAELTEQFGTDFMSMTEEEVAAFRAARAEIGKEFPAPRSTYEKFLEHLLYTLDLIGPEHVGIGADWDGGGGVDGMDDIVDLPKITADLLEAGYSEEDIANIWGGNMLRLMREVEAAKTSPLASPDILN